MATKTTSSQDKGPVAWALLRISLGFIFLWAFFDKLFGLGFATCRDAATGAVNTMCGRSWLEGGSPTTGYLNNATKGPFEEFYKGLAGAAWVDWIFMLGLLLIGIALITGIALKLAAIGGSLMLFMMWTAVLLPENNPVLDDHLVYILVLLGIYWNRDNTIWSLRGWWLKQTVVRQFPILR